MDRKTTSQMDYMMRMLEQLLKGQKKIATDIADIRAYMTDMRTERADAKAGPRADIAEVSAELKAEIVELRSDVTDLRSTVEGFDQRLEHLLVKSAKHDEEIFVLKKRL